MSPNAPRVGRLLIVVLVGLVLILATGAVVFAAVTAKSGKSITAVKTLTSDELQSSTTSTTYVNLPGVSTTISVPSTQKAILIITFSAETACQWEGHTVGFCWLRVMVDGAHAAPGEVFFNSVGANSSGSGAGWQTNSMQFVAGPLSAGSHTVTVQWHVDSNVTFQIDRRTLTILRSRV